MASFDLSKNYSLYAVPIAWLLGFLPAGYGKSLGTKYYDVAYPRTFMEQIQKDDKCPKQLKQKIQRCEAASANAGETLAIFINALVAANVAGVPVSQINTYAGAYLLSRVAYNIVYVFLQENRKLTPLRTVAWFSGVACWITLYVKSANQLLAATS